MIYNFKQLEKMLLQTHTGEKPFVCTALSVMCFAHCKLPLNAYHWHIFLAKRSREYEKHIIGIMSLARFPELLKCVVSAS